MREGTARSAAKNTYHYEKVPREARQQKHVPRSNRDTTRSAEDTRIEENSVSVEIRSDNIKYIALPQVHLIVPR